MTTNAKHSRRFARGILAAALLLGAGVAHAADAAKEERMPASWSAMMKMEPMSVMHMMDKGNKGYVTHDEFMKFQEQLFKSMDKDKDGKLSAAEFTDRG